MRFEIHHETGRKEVVNFTKDKAVVGNGENSDIIIEGEHIGRNQLILEKIDGKIFITDLDTPHGTYINDALIEPHKKIEFLSFFPIQIGPKVLIYLLAEEEAGNSLFNFKSNDETNKKNTGSSGLTNLEDFALSEKPRKEKKANAPVKATGNKNPKANKNNTNTYIIAGVIALAIGGYLYKSSSEASKNEVDNMELKDPYIAYQAETSLAQKQLYRELMTGKKCSTSIEKELCDLIKIPFVKAEEGFIIRNNKLHIVLNIDRMVVTGLNEEISVVPAYLKTQYMLMRIFSNAEMWIKLEQMGIQTIHLLNLLIIQGKLVPKSEIEVNMNNLFAAISLEDMWSALYLLRNRTDPKTLEKIDLNYLQLQDIPQ